MKLVAWPALLVGGIIVSSILLKILLEAADLPDLLGFVLLGIGFRWGDATWNVLPPDAPRLLAFMAEFGVVALLFRIGLLRSVQNLLRRLPGAAVIWLVNTTTSVGLGLLVTRIVLEWALLPSLFVTVALTTTGIGVSVRVWRSVYQLDSARGALMLDTAELDDLFGVVLLAVLSALVPQWQHGAPVLRAFPVFLTTAQVMAKLLLLTGGGLLFARYLEAPLTEWLHEAQARPDFMITVLGIGLLVAGLTAGLGFSVAIGGFFAGLLFSRDPRAVKLDAAFDSLYDLFVPFFFVYVGFSLTPTILIGQGPTVGILLGTALLGTGLGAFGGALRHLAPPEAAVLAVSLMPRSEITLLIMQRGLNLGVVSTEMFSAMVAVVIITMIGIPLALQLLLRPRGSEQPHHP